jgi:glucose-1-phosphate cytidylyltransferase
MTGVRPPSRFGEIVSEGHKITSFNEKPSVSQGYINGGFFVFKKHIFDFLSSDEDCALERKPLENVVKKGELMMFPLDTYWHCMDTYRDNLLLNQLWENGKAPWKVWD